MKEVKTYGGKVFQVDDEDYDKVMAMGPWSLSLGYVMKQKGKKVGQQTIRLHRWLMNAPDDMVVDHIDRNPLNNQKSNLRIVTQAQNGMNRGGAKNSSSKYKGVAWVSEKGKWKAMISKDAKTHRLGYFTNEHEAALAYNVKAMELFGEYGYLNEVNESELLQTYVESLTQTTSLMVDLRKRYAEKLLVLDSQLVAATKLFAKTSENMQRTQAMQEKTKSVIPESLLVEEEKEPMIEFNSKIVEGVKELKPLSEVEEALEQAGYQVVKK